MFSTIFTHGQNYITESRGLTGKNEGMTFIHSQEICKKEMVVRDFEIVYPVTTQ